MLRGLVDGFCERGVLSTFVSFEVGLFDQAGYAVR